MGTIEIKVITIGKDDTPREALRLLLEQETQRRANEGWTLRATCSRGGAIYATFARKRRG